MEIYPVFSSRVEFLLGNCHILNLMTTIVSKGVHFTAEYVFFFWVKPPPFKHPIWLWPCPKGYKNMRKAYFPALATSPSLSLSKCPIYFSIVPLVSSSLFKSISLFLALTFISAWPFLIRVPLRLSNFRGPQKPGFRSHPGNPEPLRGKSNYWTNRRQATPVKVGPFFHNSVGSHISKLYQLYRIVLN